MGSCCSGCCGISKLLICSMEPHGSPWVLIDLRHYLSTQSFIHQSVVGTGYKFLHTIFAYSFAHRECELLLVSDMPNFDSACTKSAGMPRLSSNQRF